MTARSIFVTAFIGTVFLTTLLWTMASEPPSTSDYSANLAIANARAKRFEHEHQRAEMYKRFAIAYELVYEHFDFDCWTEIGAVPAASSNVEPLEKTESSKTRKPRGNTSLKAAPGLQSNNRTDGELRYWAEQSAESDSDAVKLRRHPAAAELRIAPDSKGQPSDDEASIALYERLSDRAKERMCASIVDPQTLTSSMQGKARGDLLLTFARLPTTTLETRRERTYTTKLLSARLSGRITSSGVSSKNIFDILPVRGKGELTWRQSIRYAVARNASNTVADERIAAEPVIVAELADTAIPTTLIPCRIPIAIGKDGRLLEPCEVAPDGSSVSFSPSPAMHGSADSIAVAESRREPSSKPEEPVVCPSDALGGVTAYWNKQSVAWYRASLAYPAGEQLPWLFQCRGDLAQRAATDAAKDPGAAYDLMAWLLTWLFDHGVISRESNAWHHFTVERPADAAGVTEVVVQFNDGWLRPGEIDRDGMNGDVYADPDCSQCEVWFFAPMMPGTASVVSWGKR